MDDLEDKGPRYRLVMFIAIAAIVVPGLFLMSWMGDNGVSTLFSSILGTDKPRPTRTVGLQPTPTEAAVAPATATVAQSATQTAGTPATATPPTEPVSTPTNPPAASATATPEKATSTPAPPTATPTKEAPTTATPTEEPAPTRTPRGDILGYGTAIPAYGGAAVIRDRPSTEGEALGSIPLDASVIVLSQVEGEAIDPVESRWWEVEYEGVQGYVYYKLIQLDD